MKKSGLEIVRNGSPVHSFGEGQPIQIRGARVHNLRNVDIDIPRNQLVVITGPSGSGKSSLAFDTLYAEGKRQYIESLSIYARQFLDQMVRPDVDLIQGLQPTLCIDQQPGHRNPRSTVATVTEVYDYLRLLMARLGTAHCFQCGAVISQQSLEQISERILELPAGTKTMILAPLVRGRKGGHKDVIDRIRKAGFVRARVDGLVCDLDTVPELDPRKSHHVDAVVDRIIIKSGIDARIADSVRLAVEHGEGLLTVCFLEDQPATGGKRKRGKVSVHSKGTNGTESNGQGSQWRDELFSTSYACPHCQISYEELEPRTFSFSSPYGACPVCEGLGDAEEFDPELLLVHADKSLEEGAIPVWHGLTTTAEKKLRTQLEPFFAECSGGELKANRKKRNGAAKNLTQQQTLSSRDQRKGDDRRGDLPSAESLQWSPRWDVPFARWPAKAVEQFWQGDDKKFVGALIILEQELATSTKKKRLAQLAKYRARVVCQACGGSRLRPEATSVLLAGKAIHQIVGMSVGRALEFLASVELTEEEWPIGGPLIAEMTKRLDFLRKVGVDYLTLDRSADTLSGGEFQRVRLATSIGSGLVGVCYVLDEPSIGLHPRDNERLIESLRDLQALGNTVLVVEHDEAVMRQADRLIDMGPGAGHMGGTIVGEGTPDEVCANPQSVTGRYLSGKQQITSRPARRKTSKTRSLFLQGVETHNLKKIDVRIPLGVLVGISGVSGSGKSSLINETLAPALIRRFGGGSGVGGGRKPGPFQSLRGANHLDKVIQIDQTAIGRTPRSNPATYTGLFDEIRKMFAGTRESKQRGFNLSRFSFNSKGGRCEQCQGQGTQRVEMSFLPDLFVVCDECQGARFNRQTLQVRYKGKSIADVLSLSVDAAAEFFANFANIMRIINSLQAVGLGYVSLGQPSTTLSGGEAQRVRLATELSRTDTGKTLYVLDEPTTGLHFEDIQRLLNVLQQLVDKGNTVLVIEHNLDVIRCADWLIDLGPEGGEGGGQLVAQGTPEDLANCPDSHTGRYLRECMS